MSSAPHPPSSGAPAAPAAPRSREITLISHSMLFYWWPIWLLGFTLAIWTWNEDHRLAIVPNGSKVRVQQGGPQSDTTTYVLDVKNPTTRSLDRAVEATGQVGDEPAFRTRISQHAWMGPLFCVVLLMTVVITNVPLRGLWSFLVLLMILVVALIITLIPSGWDKLLTAVNGLHIYINMAGYLFIAVVVFILWAVSVFLFDQRTYIVVTPGQIRVCEHVGASIRTFDTVGLSFEKQRDDLFRHWLLGFFSGDLIVRTSGAEKETIRLPNVLWIGWRLEEVQKLLAEKATVAA